MAATTHAAAAQESGGPRQQRVDAVAEWCTAGEPSTAQFLEQHVHAGLVERVGAPALTRTLESLRAALTGGEVGGYAPEGKLDAWIFFDLPSGAEVELWMRLAEAAPHGIVDLWLEGHAGLDPDAQREPPPPPLTWDNLEERMAAEVEAGFSGALLVVRDGETVLDRGFGLANREAGIAATPDTVFALGSTPIDFTRAGALLLWQDEVLGMDEPLTAFFDDVPDDKRGITVEHMMSGQSGLEDFHDRPGDRDPDHAWIDRDEAVRRILEGPLLFEPGRGRRHSHSAWGLLAAIIEIRSGLPYQDFTREMLFEPAGMESTGFNGDPVPRERLALGYGFRSDGDVNAPPHWGETSWLVMGSGGMVGTTRDMLRWNQALRSGALLGDEALRRFWSPPGALAAAGDMYGFEIRYTEGPGSLFVLVTNACNMQIRRRFDRLGSDIHTLLR